MPNLATIEVMPERLVEHRASRAWSQLGPERVEPERIEVLKLKSKSAVYRLAGVGPGGTAVIAKRCRSATAVVERMIHEELLARLPLPALRCYGFVAEADGEFCWLFLEEATGEYSPNNPRHRALAGHWLGTIHRAAMDAGLADRLPPREPRHYLGLLRSARAALREHLTNPGLPEPDLRLLESVVGQCDVLEAHWDELESWCAGYPRTLVHGDFVIKNVRVRPEPGAPAFLAFDWEIAGWGVPATDLAQRTGRIVSVDLEAYRVALAECGAPPDARAVERLAESGRFFRLLDDISWACVWMVNDSYLFMEKPISFLRSYATRLAGALRAAGWAEAGWAVSPLAHRNQ